MRELTTTPFTSEDYFFCKKSLSEVSRTFALNIKVLEGDLYKSVLLCYLLCRIIDTVEDCPDRDATWKVDLLNGFPLFLETHEDEQLSSWISKVLEGEAKPPEKDLIKHTSCVLRGYWSLPENLRSHNRKWVKEMASGMAQFITKFGDSKKVILANKQELEDYCYYVAGTVGCFLTSNFEDYYGFSDKKAAALQRNAVSFGIGLQLTNIAKDIMEDRKRGWTYLPMSYLKKHEIDLEDFFDLKSVLRPEIKKAYFDLLDDALKHLEDGLEYSLLLPRSNLRVRLFCLLPLWMAIETIIKLKDQYDDLMMGKKVKISRKQVKETLIMTTLMSPSNKLLRKNFEAKVAKFKKDHST